MLKNRGTARVMSIARWAIFCVGLFVWGCASSPQTRDFTFVPLTDETFPEVPEARLYRSGLGQPHQVIGEVTILGEPDEGLESLEERLLEEARNIGAQGVIVLEVGEEVHEVGKAGTRHNLPRGAAGVREIPLYPSAVPIEEVRIFIKGMAIRFTGQ